jgi:hypothetical protein
LDSFLGRSSPEAPRRETSSKISVLASTKTVPRFNLEKVELSHPQGWLTKTVNAPFQAFETLASFYV